jgi:hypothetical protein
LKINNGKFLSCCLQLQKNMHPHKVTINLIRAILLTDGCNIAGASSSSTLLYHNGTFICTLFQNWNAKFIFYWLREICFIIIHCSYFDYCFIRTKLRENFSSSHYYRTLSGSAIQALVKTSEVAPTV